MTTCRQAIAQVKFEAPEMRLYDAMAEAVEQLKTRPTNYRRVMLIVGESQDIESDTKLGLVLARLRSWRTLRFMRLDPAAALRTCVLVRSRRAAESSIRRACLPGRRGLARLQIPGNGRTAGRHHSILRPWRSG